MPTLTQGNSTTVSVSNGQYVSLKNTRNEAARIEFANGIPVRVGHNGTAVYGPFASQMLKVSAVFGSVTYNSGNLNAVAPMGRL